MPPPSAPKRNVPRPRTRTRRRCRGPAGPPAGALPPGPAVIDVTEVTFEAEVLDRSMSQLVVVDLWAEWCGPCKQLSPVLERLAAQSGGRWVLAKVDVDANPRIAQAFRVQSIPMVVAIVQGQPVTAFNGVRSEAEITAWIDEIFAQVGHVLTGTPADAPAEEPTDPRMAAAEEKMNEGDFDGALAVYRSIVEAEPDNVEAASAARISSSSCARGRTTRRSSRTRRRTMWTRSSPRPTSCCCRRSRRRRSTGSSASCASPQATSASVPGNVARAVRAARSGRTVRRVGAPQARHGALLSTTGQPRKAHRPSGEVSLLRRDRRGRSRPVVRRCAARARWPSSRGA